MRRVQLILSLIFFITTTCNSFAQVDLFNLSNREITRIICKVDTLSGIRNYHLLIKALGKDTFQVNIYINDRLGGTINKEKGIDICRFFKYKRNLVFIYEFRKCNCDIPSQFITEIDPSTSDYLKKFPFLDRKGFHKEVLVTRGRKNLEIFETQEVKDDGFENLE